MDDEVIGDLTKEDLVNVGIATGHAIKFLKAAALLYSGPISTSATASAHPAACGGAAATALAISSSLTSTQPPLTAPPPSISSHKRENRQEDASECDHQRIKRVIVYSENTLPLSQPKTFDEASSQKVPKYHLNESQMNTWKAFVKSNCEFKTLESLQSYNDTANCRITTKLNPDHVKQCKDRDARHAIRSGVESMPLTNDKDTAACLGYAEMSLHSFHETLSKIHHIIGPSNPANFLDIGHGTTAHLVISASESGRFNNCAGIEIGVNRFTASLKAVEIAKRNGFLSKDIHLVQGDVLTNAAIQLSNYNVYIFFDKVCKEVSQQTIKKIILEHTCTNFALGPIVYATCMGTHYLKQAMIELRESMSSSNSDRLLIAEKEYINVTTRHAHQKFKCTLFCVWLCPESRHLIKTLSQKLKKRVEHIWRLDQSLDKVDGTELSILDFKILAAPMMQKQDPKSKPLDPQLTSFHMNAWTKLLEDASRTFRYSDSGAKPLLVFKDSFFYTKFEQPQSAQQNNDQACRWLKNLDISYLFRLGYLCFHVHMPGHWFMAGICFREHEICFLDSIPKDHKKWFDRLIDFLTHLAKTKCTEDVQFDPTEWKKVEVDVPCQENAYDCGVFSCVFMLHFVAAILQSRQPSFPFDQRNIDEIRYAMAAAFLEDSILSVLEEWFIRFYTDE